MRIGGLDLSERVMIVTEIGNNHEGSFDLAARLIDLAAEAGVNAVKFQTYRTEHYVSRRDRRRFQQLKSFELTFEVFERLSRVAADAGVLFLSTPFDLESARFLEDLVPAYKIASGDITFFPLLEVVAGTGKPLMISTGLAELDQIADAKATIERIWSRRGIRQELALLHCVSSYPTPASEANLAAISTLKAIFGDTVGYSDHTEGIEAAVLSVAAGARIVEKHFTIAKDHSDFRDHQLSAEPSEMAHLVGRIRAVEVLLGDGHKGPQPCEQSVEALLRRSIAASRDLPTGTVLSPRDLTWVRPATGLAPGQEHRVVGRTLTVGVEAGGPVTPEMLVEEAAPV
jgi:sialic acid synthase SpsE